MSWVKKCKKYLLVLFICLCFGSVAQAGSNLWYYGDQLTGIAKAVYDGLEKVPNIQNYYATVSNGRLVKGKGIYIKLDKSYSMYQYNKIMQETAKAADAFIRDHSEFFWINGMGYEFGTNRYTGNFDAVTVYPCDYYNGIRKEISNTRKALNYIINYVKKYKTRYEKVKAAHDFIIKFVSYNTDDADAEYSHTITGPLLNRYGHKGVCEAYAKLFDIVCKANGIPSITITSRKIVGNKVYSINHMWNYVQMDNGKWYVVDVTFDDPIGGDSEGDYDYFLVGSNTNVWGQKIKETHTGTGYCIASLTAYTPFKLPTLAKKAFTLKSNKNKNKNKNKK